MSTRLVFIWTWLSYWQYSDRFLKVQNLDSYVYKQTMGVKSPSKCKAMNAFCLGCYCLYLLSPRNTMAYWILCSNKATHTCISSDNWQFKACLTVTWVLNGWVNYCILCCGWIMTWFLRHDLGRCQTTITCGWLLSFHKMASVSSLFLILDFNDLKNPFTAKYLNVYVVTSAEYVNK